uniref:Uncharacterized protein n=1 Tax=Rhizophora mucronata TaxID=61149 RepID=A0A2P2MXG6_RHIMU
MGNSTKTVRWNQTETMFQHQTSNSKEKSRTTW